MMRPIKSAATRLLRHRRGYYYQLLFRRTSAADIRSALDALGVGPGSTVLVHSALSSLGHFLPGPEGLIRLLLEVIGPDGTILMPAFPFTGSMEDYAASDPVFDVRSTRSRSGQLTEAFRRHSGVLRSLHPTHSFCALGRQADELTRDHHKAGTPCGPDSPLGRFAAGDGIVLRLGTGALTLYHHIQEAVDFPHLFIDGDTEFRCRTALGEEIGVRTRVYRKRIPQILHLDVDTRTESWSVHPSDFPLLYRGDREEHYRKDPRRQALLHRLLGIRGDFEAKGLLKSHVLHSTPLEAFRAKNYRDYAVREIRSLLQEHSGLYDLRTLEQLLAAGGYPR
jgi:aminoglycoside N3'-acetyltransferase